MDGCLSHKKEGKRVDSRNVGGQSLTLVAPTPCNNIRGPYYNHLYLFLKFTITDLMCHSRLQEENQLHTKIFIDMVLYRHKGIEHCSRARKNNEDQHFNADVDGLTLPQTSMETHIVPF